MSDSHQSTVIYVTARGHSGSTLTEMLLAGHSQIVALGEIRQLGTVRQEACRCGARTIAICAFWQSVDAELQRTSRLSLSTLSLEDDDDEIFAAHNEAIFRAVFSVTGARYVIDASKTLARLSRLERCGRVPMRILHLVRSPYGVVHSNAKRGRNWRDHAQNYTVAMMKSREWLADVESTLLRYEDLVEDPSGELRRVLGDFGLSFEESQLDWANQEIHTFAGNPMRTTRNSTIRPDVAWRRGLGWRRVLGITWWTLPTRVGSRWLYDGHRPYWKGEGWRAWRVFRKQRRIALRQRWRLHIKRNRWLGPFYVAALGLYRRLGGRAGGA